MAGIDKIFGTQQQYIELEKWLKENKPSALRYMRLKKDIGKFGVIAEFPAKIDMWLYENCPIAFVKERIAMQYGFYYYVEKLKNKRICVMRDRIKNKNAIRILFKKLVKPDEINTYNEKPTCLMTIDKNIIRTETLISIEAALKLRDLLNRIL